MMRSAAGASARSKVTSRQDDAISFVLLYSKMEGLRRFRQAVTSQHGDLSCGPTENNDISPLKL